jgi:ABC-type cobalamin/Fe3+-siderophores transport system ATPase subunit
MKAGSTPDQPSLDVDLSSVTVFVGPNNSGKSRALQEIEAWIRNPTPPQTVVIKALEFDSWTSQDIERAVSEIQVEPTINESLAPDHVLITRLNPQGHSAFRTQIHKPGLLHEAQNPNAHRSRYAGFLSMLTLKLDGTNRLALINPQPAGDLQKTAPNHLAHLFLDNEARSTLRRVVYDAFGKYLVVDPTDIGQLRLRLSSRPPTDEREEKGWDSVAQAFHKAAFPIVEASDGVKAFVGMLSTIIAGDPKITLIDEPEAFLHPALSARLGKELTAALGSTNRRLIVATHSASFLMGCVQAGAGVNIIRLTFDYEVATARLLAREKLAPLMRNPLLRSVGVLDALFYNAVIVTEADADRAFYQEVNERLLAANDPRGIAGCLFLNAQNKQTVWDIVRPLRELGIPAAGVIDIDIVKEGGTVWQKPMQGAFVPPLSHNSLQAERAAILAAFNSTGKDMKRDGGVALLSKSDQEACRNFLSKLSEYGIYIVENGELESWLRCESR